MVNRQQIASLRAKTQQKVMLAIAFTANKRLSAKTYHFGTYLDSEAYVHFVRKTDDKLRAV